MKRRAAILLVFAAALAAFARADDDELGELMDSAERWAQENLDEDVIALFEEADGERIRQLFAALQKEFAANDVLDLGELNGAARAILPLLEGYEETLPYALWLRPRLDYLEVAETFRKAPTPRLPPGETVKPEATVLREAWVRKLKGRPWPEPARRHVKALKPIFASERVPPELVWIAEVESSFDSRARSPAGAAGLFQLMPATARRFGLRTWPVDHRYRPEPSARAAAQYLRLLHGQFKDWRLALAAYNAGEGTVQRLLARRQAASFDAIATLLPAETQMYVPKVESALLRREGLRLSELRAPAVKK